MVENVNILSSRLSVTQLINQP